MEGEREGAGEGSIPVPPAAEATETVVQEIVEEAILEATTEKVEEEVAVKSEEATTEKPQDAPTPPARPPRPPRATPVADVSSSSTEVGGASEPAAAVAESSEGGEEIFMESAAAKKNLAEILAHDAEDESLRKYKEALLGAAAKGDLGDTSDPRRLVVTEFRVIFDPDEGRPDTVFELDSADKIASLKRAGLTMKEGCKYKFRISFRVQHDILSGIQFVNKVKKMMFTDKEELVLGSYAPASVPHVFEFPRHGFSEAPKGMMYRGTYHVTNRFICADKITHLEYDYELRINKGWD